MNNGLDPKAVRAELEKLTEKEAPKIKMVFKDCFGSLSNPEARRASVRPAGVNVCGRRFDRPHGPY